jgi:hypothetical protein
MLVAIEIMYKTPPICICSALPTFVKRYRFSIHWPEKATEKHNFISRKE